eukprot:4604380-Pyramimonas_sp.AAC.1
MKKASKVSQGGISTSANVETVVPRFDVQRHDATTIFVGGYSGCEDDIRRIVHLLAMDNMLCTVSFGKHGPAFVKWRLDLQEQVLACYSAFRNASLPMLPRSPFPLLEEKGGH